MNREALEKYPILNELAPTSFNPNNFVKFVTFGLNFEPQFSKPFIDKNKGYYIPTSEPIISRQLYNIYLENEDTFIIVFKE